MNTKLSEINLNEAVEQNYEKWLKAAKKNVPSDKAEDILHTVIIQLYDSKTPLESIGNLDAYIARSVWISYISNNSLYNRTWHSKEVLESDFEPIEPIDEEIEEIGCDVWDMIDRCGCSWWEKEIFKRKVLEDKTFAEIAEETNLSLGQVYYSFRKVRNACKNLYNK